jgi:hypothetical protein
MGCNSKNVVGFDENLFVSIFQKSNYCCGTVKLGLEILLTYSFGSIIGLGRR